MVEDCAAGERLGWYEFVRDYAPIARRLLNHYFPMLAPELDSQIVQLFQRARVADNAWFQQLRFSNEREFLMGFREFLFAYGREIARVPTPEISLDQLRTIMSDLPLVEREMLWMFVKGYDPETAAAMMSNTEATARATRKIADDRLAKILPEATAGAFNVSARVLIAEAEKTGGDECASLKTFNNLVNGQVSWRERDLAEEHIAKCFRCLDRFTSFQEMIRIRKEAHPLQEFEIERILSQLTLPGAKKGKGLFARLLGK